MKLLSLIKSIIFVQLLLFQILHASESTKSLKIAIISLYDEDYKNIAKYSDENKEKYAKKHGYDFIVYREPLDISRPTAWSKILALQKHLKDYDWLYWSDADSLIMNPDIKLESFIDENFDVIISDDCISLNTGSFLIKNTEWSAQFLQDIYLLKDYPKTHRWEQAAFNHLVNINPERLSHVKSLVQRALNATIPNPKLDGICIPKPDAFYKIGDFVVHFYGPGDKEMLMKEWSEKIDWK